MNGNVISFVFIVFNFFLFMVLFCSSIGNLVLRGKQWYLIPIALLICLASCLISIKICVLL